MLWHSQAPAQSVLSVSLQQLSPTTLLRWLLPWLPPHRALPKQYFPATALNRTSFPAVLNMTSVHLKAYFSPFHSPSLC